MTWLHDYEGGHSRRQRYAQRIHAVRVGLDPVIELRVALGSEGSRVWNRATVKVELDLITARVVDVHAVENVVVILTVVDRHVWGSDGIPIPRVSRAYVNGPVGVNPPGKLHRRTVGHLQVLLVENTELEDRYCLSFCRYYDAAQVVAGITDLGVNIDPLGQ